jgi:hypothetical protein
MKKTTTRESLANWLTLFILLALGWYWYPPKTPEPKPPNPAPVVAAAPEVVAPPPPVYDPNDKNCDHVPCNAGSSVRIVQKKDDIFYACQTQELAEYANYVITVYFMETVARGHMPNILPKTGEPETTPKIADSLEFFRKKAGVSGLDEALFRCQKGWTSNKLMVANYPTNSPAMWVYDPTLNLNTWIPKTYLEGVK